MGVMKILAIVLIAAGVFGLIYGSFTYTKETHKADLGPVELSVDEKETIGVPVWAGAGAIAIGSLLLLLGRSRS